ncbi:MAG: acetolactate synthase small subunit [Balneolaceae bacterium]
MSNNQTATIQATELKHTLSVLLKHNLNSFSRIIGIFSGKGFEIDSITFASEADPGMARITVTTYGDEKTVEQITKHMHNVIDVLKVTDLTHKKFIERELALIKVSSSTAGRTEIMLVAQAFNAKVIDLSQEKLSLEVTGNRDKIDALIEVLRPFGIISVARTGSVAMKREFKGLA